MATCGVFATTALTSVNAGNTRGVKRTHLIPVSEIEAQIDAVLDDFDIQAAKTGMLATTDIIETVTGYAKELPNLVVDPVMVTAAGDRLLDTAAEEAYEDLIATARVVTPNAEEAAALTGIEPTTERDLRAAGQAIVEMEPKQHSSKVDTFQARRSLTSSLPPTASNNFVILASRRT
jgi:hydroxymethylpyrimidine/phosphomethylpyrimidine kinase